nr:helix-turn-helix domain-containing protein [Pseudoclavibacter chungangensis]
MPHVEPLVEGFDALVVVSDAEGRVLARESAGRLRTLADGIGFRSGALWNETHMGTNAIGTALATRRPVQVHGAEHFLVEQHGWSCAAAPVRDPRTGAVLGAIDLSAELDHGHPALLSLVSSLARTAGLELGLAHRTHLGALRAAAFAATRGVAGPWAVVDEAGWVAEANEVDVRARITLPDGLTPGPTWLPPLGDVEVERLGDGWLAVAVSGTAGLGTPGLASVALRPGPQGTTIVLDSAGHRRRAFVTPRQGEILVLLAQHPAGLTAPELSAIMYGTPEHDVTVRAEISRLRRHLGELIVAAPYRFAPGVDVRTSDEDLLGR